MFLTGSPGCAVSCLRIAATGAQVFFAVCAAYASRASLLFEWYYSACCKGLAPCYGCCREQRMVVSVQKLCQRYLALRRVLKDKLSQHRKGFGWVSCQFRQLPRKSGHLVACRRGFAYLPANSWGTRSSGLTATVG